MRLLAGLLPTRRLLPSNSGVLILGGRVVAAVALGNENKEDTLARFMLSNRPGLIPTLLLV